MNYTYLKNHGDFLKFIKRLDEENMAADYTGALQKSAFSNLEYLIEVLGGNIDKYKEMSFSEDEDYEYETDVEESILSFGPFAAEPKSYPAIVVWYFEESFDRHGNVSTSILNFISLKELKTRGEIRSQPTPDEWLKETVGCTSEEWIRINERRPDETQAAFDQALAKCKDGDENNEQK